MSFFGLEPGDRSVLASNGALIDVSRNYYAIRRRTNGVFYSPERARVLSFWSDVHEALSLGELRDRRLARLETAAHSVHGVIAHVPDANC
jgi:hypothetical protein